MMIQGLDVFEINVLKCKTKPKLIRHQIFKVLNTIFRRDFNYQCTVNLIRNNSVRRQILFHPSYIKKIILIIRIDSHLLLNTLWKMTLGINFTIQSKHVAIFIILLLLLMYSKAMKINLFMDIVMQMYTSQIQVP